MQTFLYKPCPNQLAKTVQQGQAGVKNAFGLHSNTVPIVSCINHVSFNTVDI